MIDLAAWHNLELEFLAWRHLELRAQTSGLDGEPDRWTLHGDGISRFVLISREAARRLGHTDKDAVNFWLDQVRDFLLRERDQNLEYAGTFTSARAESPEIVKSDSDWSDVYHNRKEWPGGPERRIDLYTILHLFQASADFCRSRPYKTEPSTRRGYSAEIRKWMQDKELKTTKQAADRLQIGHDTLKSIMTTKGMKRYSDETLKMVLKTIGHKGQ